MGQAMLPGLVMTCMVTLLACASWHLRRTRHGWVDELDLVRGDALTAPRREMATAVAIAEAIDARDRLDGKNTSWAVSSIPATGARASGPDHGNTEAVEAGDPEAGHDEGYQTDAVAESIFDNDIWTQPSPHPIRPSEMWHPGVGSSALSRDGMPQDPALVAAVEAQMDVNRRRFARFRPVSPPTAKATEAWETGDVEAPEAPAVVAPVIPDPSSAAMLRGPVARRRRGDRARPSLADARGPLRAKPPAGPEERSPLPEARLGPAEPPRRPVHPARTEAGDTEAVSPVGRSTERDADRTMAPEAAAATRHSDVPAALMIDERYEVALGSTVLRFNEGHRTSLRHLADGPEVDVAHGWCWVTTLGAGSTVPVRIGLPSAELVVAAGAKALAMVDDDGSTFLVIVEGSANMVRSGEAAPLPSGLMVLLAADGALQVDQARRSEIEADPMVARNLALDATR